MLRFFCRCSMVLKDGGPCIAFKKDRGSAVTTICSKTRDHLWYAGPTCKGKGCYERSNHKRKTEVPWWPAALPSTWRITFSGGVS